MVSMVTSLWAKYLRDCGSVCSMEKRFVTFPKGPEWLWGTPHLLSLGTMVCYLYTFLGLCIAGYESSNFYLLCPVFLIYC